MGKLINFYKKKNQKKKLFKKDDDKFTQFENLPKEKYLFLWTLPKE